MDVIKYSLITTVLLTYFSAPTFADERVKLPTSSSQVFNSASNDPNVIFYNAEKEYNRGDDGRALALFLKAAQYGHEASIVNAKTMIASRLGIAKNKQSVVDFLLSLAADGDNDAVTYLFLADVYRGDACIWFPLKHSEPCNASDLPSTDASMTYHFYSEAAKRGSVRANHALAMSEATGTGVGKNPALALSRFEDAAEKGSSSAAYIAGMMLSGYHGIAPNPERARNYFEMAAKAGHSLSMLELANNLHRKGAQEHDNVSLQKSVEWYKKVIESQFSSPENRVRAQYELAMLLQGQPQIAGPNALMDDILRSKIPSEYHVKALIMLSQNLPQSAAEQSLEYLLDAASMLEKMPVSVQQRNAVVWHRIASIMAQGTSKRDANSSEYGNNMTKYRQVMEAFPEPTPSDSFFGVGIYDYIGIEP